MMTKNSNVRIFQSPEELALAAAQVIKAIAEKAVENKGSFTIALSGGDTPKQLFWVLSQPPFCYEMPWFATFIFWGDERCLALNDPKTNSYTARELLLDKVAIPAGNIHVVPVDLAPAKAAVEYAKTIKSFFKEDAPVFDLILLGLGENGHTASLFPGSDIDFDTKDLVKEVYVEEQKMWRITMTPLLINQASNIVFLVEGEGKAEILNTVLNAPYQPNVYPAQLIKPVDGGLTWFADGKAAASLV